MLPSPSLTRQESPEFDSEFEQEFEQEPGSEDTTFETSGLHNKISEVIHDFHVSSSKLKTVHSLSCAENTSVVSSSACVVLMLILFGLDMYGLGSFLSLRVFMGAVAALMLLPGIYLYMVDGCRPEDYEECVSETKGPVPTFLLASLGIISLYCNCTSLVLRVFMGALPAFMLLPGIYLYVVDGCRPEDYRENETQKNRGVPVVLLASFGFFLLYGMCVSMVFRLFMGAVAALMLLPGTYLHVVDGCMPEDYQESNDLKQSWKLVFLLVSLACSLYGIGISMVFQVLMGCVAVMMLLPGIYLHVVDGCRPEDYKGSVSEAKGRVPMYLFASLVIILLHGGCTFTVFCVFLAAMAALMLLPGMYLYLVDGCRPEDYRENDTQKNRGVPVVLLASFGFFLLSGMCVSMVFRLFMGAVAALMLLPGTYLHVVDGCMPEGYQESNDLKQSWKLVFLLVSLACSLYGIGISMVFQVLMGCVAAMMLLPGIYLHVVDGCRPEDYKGSVSEAKGRVPMYLFASLVIILLHGGCTFTVFCVFLAAVAALMLLPGMYLYVVDGCRPEDYLQDVNQWSGGVLAVLLANCGFLLLYSMGISAVFQVSLAALAALMVLPGIYLYVGDGCRPECLLSGY